MSRHCWNSHGDTLPVDSQFTDRFVYILCVTFSVCRQFFTILGKYVSVCITREPTGHSFFYNCIFFLSQLCVRETVRPCDWFDRDPPHNKSRKKMVLFRSCRRRQTVSQRGEFSNSSPVSCVGWMRLDQRAQQMGIPQVHLRGYGADESVLLIHI